MKTYSIANQKGGVGKTTTVHNLAAGIYMQTQKKPLLIDLDPQCNLSMACGLMPDQVDHSYFDFLRGADFEDVGHDVGFADIIPANHDCVLAESWIENKRRGRQVVIQKRMEELAGYEYDYVFFDCPGNLGFVTVNAMIAASKVLVTLQCEYFALEGMAKMQQEIQAIEEDGKSVELCGIVPTLWNGTTLNYEVRNEVRSQFKDIFYEVRIRRNVKLGESPSHGKHIFDYAAGSHGAEDYAALSREFLRREQ
ncbi:ParA family protein [Pseudodesulfovibrio senegalensis]|uniref:ParA family protein n=1 Tax=Pseudodesulfovibrio senegalensis TaxID=1721087 RepID=A0A6N6N0B4_9BACT|nr:ParA family protein [Pseudodesulfovibrio senegalensis]KAB1437324.1 ParA family protein [Pseudodesulfovibrio senegalensis]